jgi:hypothetical protein
MVSLFEDFGGRLPPLTQLFVPFWLTGYAYGVPAVGSVLLILVEIFAPSERFRFVVQIVYSTVWLLFVTAGFVALMLPCWKMSGTVGG